MTSTAVATSGTLRALRVGDRVPTSSLGPMSMRRLEATALVVPGRNGLGTYLAELESFGRAFADWDGRVHVVEPDGAASHRLLVVDRYRQVYAVHDATAADALPGPEELSEWFRFLATACPECGVIDDPLLTGPTP
jgi:hypothetical protein